MGLAEVSLLILSAAAVIIAIAVVIVVAHVLPLLARVDTLVGEANATLQRVNRITGDVEGVVRDVRQLESRVNRSLGTVLDQVEPPLRLLSAVLAGARAGVAALFAPRKEIGRNEANPPAQQGGNNE